MLTGGAQGNNVYFVVGSSATLGTSTTLTGRIVALTSITLNTTALIDCGAALARNGSVTLDNNVINVPDSSILNCKAALTPGAFGDSLDDSATEAEQAVAAAFDEFIANGGVLPLGFQILASTLTPTELAAALAQLSGEAGTGTAPTGVQAMDSFLNVVGDAGYGFGTGVYPLSAPTESSPPVPATVRVLGYVSDDAPAVNSAFASFGGGQAPGTLAPDHWHVWAAGYGGYRLTDGDSSAGTHERTSSNYGVATGFDYLVTPDTKLGFAIGGGGTRFALADDLGSGKSDMLQVALYGRSELRRGVSRGRVRLRLARRFDRARHNPRHGSSLGGIHCP